MMAFVPSTSGKRLTAALREVGLAGDRSAVYGMDIKTSIKGLATIRLKMHLDQDQLVAIAKALSDADPDQRNYS